MYLDHLWKWMFRKNIHLNTIILYHLEKKMWKHKYHKFGFQKDYIKISSLHWFQLVIYQTSRFVILTFLSFSNSNFILFQYCIMAQYYRLYFVKQTKQWFSNATGKWHQTTNLALLLFRDIENKTQQEMLGKQRRTFHVE